MAVEAEATMAAQGGWSSLPADLVNRVADCLLATNDLDYYVDLRGVCHNWRSSTTEPRSNPHDPRFFPTRWIMLEERRDLFAVARDDDTRLFVNSTTGRFVRRSLPQHLLDRDYHFVTSTGGGFVVLAEREAPHAARVLNPFTGCMIRFMAPMPMEVQMTADVVVGATGDLPKLVLVSSTSTSADADRLFRFYLADPGSEEFLLLETSSAEASELLDPSPAVRSRVPLLCGLAAELAPGEMVRIERNPQQGVRLFRMDSAGRAMEQQVTSIGTRALFVWDQRCVSINADRIPSVDANCIYSYCTNEDVGMISYVYDLTYDTVEIIKPGWNWILSLQPGYMVCPLEAAEAGWDLMPNYICPFPVPYLLIYYVMCPAPYFEPGWDRMMQDFGLSPDMFLELMQQVENHVDLF